MIYLGIRTFLQRVEGDTPNQLPPASLSRIYRQGIVVAVLNPKTALFFLAFLPQFVDPSRAAVAIQVGLLGVLLVIVTATSDSCYALIAGAAGTLMRRNARIQRGGQLVSGGSYIALGVTAAVTGDRAAPAL